MGRRRHWKPRPFPMARPAIRPQAEDGRPPEKKLLPSGWFVMIGSYPYMTARIIAKEFRRAGYEVELEPEDFNGYYQIVWRRRPRRGAGAAI